MAGFVVYGDLAPVRRDGEAGVSVIERKAHSLIRRKACLLQPDIGDLHPGHECRRALVDAVVGFGAQRHAGAVV